MTPRQIKTEDTETFGVRLGKWGITDIQNETQADLGDLVRKIGKLSLLSRVSQCHLIQGHATCMLQTEISWFWAKVVAGLK